MSYTTITRYNECDILRNNNDMEKCGYSSTKTEGEMIDLAILHRCKLIVKNGKNGKWYLKGQDKTIEYLKGKINEHIGKSRNGVFCLLLE